jgi:hypothetical protein
MRRIRRPDDLPPEWREEYEERAAIMEFDGGMSRPEAEAAALRDVARRIGREWKRGAEAA